MNRAQRNIHLQHAPIGEPDRGAPFGERLDPGTVGSGGGWMTLAGTALNFIGNQKASSNATDVGDAQARSLNAQSDQLDVNAGQSVAAAQRQALIDRRRTALVASRGLAVAAAGGGATTDPTVAKLLADIAGEGEYRSASAIYQGEAQAREMRGAADIRRNEAGAARRGGEAKSDAYQLASFGSLARGGATMYARYGQGGPSMSTKDASPWLDAGTGNDIG